VRLRPREGASTEPVPVPVEITLTGATPAEDIDPDDVPVVAVRDSDGLTLDGLPDALPPGAWTILVGGRLSAYDEARGLLTVGEAPPAAVVLRLVRRPTVRFVLDGDPEKVGVTLVSARDERHLSPEMLRAGEVPVPRGEECSLRLDWEGGTSFVPVPASLTPGSDPIRLRPAHGATLSLRLTDRQGAPVSGWIIPAGRVRSSDRYGDWDPESEPVPAPSATVRLPEDDEVLVVPADRALAPQRVQVPVPPVGPVASIDGGVVVLHARGDRRVTVLGIDGKPAEGATVRAVPDPSGQGGVVPEDGVVDPPLQPFSAGDVVEVALAEDWTPRMARPLVRRLEGPGPWTIRWDLPSTTVVVEPTDGAGKRIAGVLIVDGKPFTIPAFQDEDGPVAPFEVVGLESGPHIIAVAAENRLTRVYRVILREGEKRVLRAALKSVPRPAK
jgi:hypothetical protein